MPLDPAYKAGLPGHLAVNTPAAVKALQQKDFDIVITADRAILREVKAHYSHIPVIRVSGNDQMTPAMEALRLGADDYLQKPFTHADLLEIVNRCHEKMGLLKPNLDETLLSMIRIMSHDIRSPLVSMLSTLKLLNRGYFGGMEEGAAGKVGELLSNATRLIGMAEEYLGGMLELSEGFKFETEHVFLIQDILNPVLEELSAELKGRQLQRVGQLKSFQADKIFINGNKTSLKAIFRNLIRNAIRHSEEESMITIGLEKIHRFYRFNIYNDGIPVLEEWQDRLFKKFRNIGREDHPGMGLGLYLMNKIIEKHGGKIWYESKERGSNFVFTLPMPFLSSGDKVGTLNQKFDVKSFEWSTAN